MPIGLAQQQPSFPTPTVEPGRTWRARFPNPPDLCFDYRRLVEQPGGVARATDRAHRICIIGAGVTGLSAAHELLRCGFTDITLLEQSRRIGGRHLTVIDKSQPATTGSTPFEMGAMRLPYFNREGEAPLKGRSVLAHYTEQFNLRLSDFANPGSAQVRSTGIFLREGLLEGQETPRMLIWDNRDGQTPPPGKLLKQVHEKWRLFAERMTRQVEAHYASEGWENLWSAIVQRYESLSFRNLVTLPAISHWQADDPGNFGGVGMSAEESAIFYAIGIGDGSWGAFYDACSLYPIRTAIFGFSHRLQLIHGRVDERGNPLPSPHLQAGTLLDCNGLTFEAPRYLGVAALDECLLFMPVEGRGLSFYEHCRQRGAGLATQAQVNGLSKLPNQQIRVDYAWQWNDPQRRELRSEVFDSVILTLPSWLIETTVELKGFDERMLPFHIRSAYKTAHWETSCKVFAPLKKSFFTEPHGIPQALVTDSLIHDMYTYSYNDSYPYDCILLSYTWEDDATKLALFSDQELVEKCVGELDRILLHASNINQRISPYIDTQKAAVHRWMSDRNALGAAKLYRPGTYYEAIDLMNYNRHYSARSGLYLCGESFSVDAGWTEPCLRGALDATIHLCQRTGATFNGGFSLKHYPEYSGRPPANELQTAFSIPRLF